MAKKYTKTHEWVEYDQGKARIGISRLAQQELGEIVYIELPKVGSLLNRGELAVVLESTKAAIDVYSPISGSVTAINVLLKDNPALINQEPEQDGWLYEIDVQEFSGLNLLLDEKDYLFLMQQ